ncbi:MAG: chemotaxis protein CheC [Lachnospiraceae bacterium]|nr:chemotaxis protein CheC [Lachnospiraceae bacterium]
MDEINVEKISQEYFDVLKELGNIGAGNATTALAQMLQCKVDMKVPQVQLLEFKNVGAMIGGEEHLMTGIYLGVEGDITGSIMFLMEQETARHLVSKMMMGMDSGGDRFNEMELSALKEVGNIITGSYLNSLSDLTRLTIYPTIPSIATDMAGAILSVPAIEFGVYGDKILLIQTQFSDEVDLNGYFILVPDVDSYTKILSSLGIISE